MLSSLLALILYVLVIIVGGLIFSILTLFTAPYTRIQTILQCMEKSDEPLGAVQIFKRIIKYEGYRGLWTTYLPPIFGFFLSELLDAAFIKFFPSIYENASYIDGESYLIWILINVYGQAVKITLVTIFIYPLEFAELKLAYDVRLNEFSKTQYKGIKHLFKKTLLNDGISGFYSGFGLDFLGMLGFLWIKWSSLALMHIFGFQIKSAIPEYVSEYFAFSSMYPLVILRCRVMARPQNYGKTNIWKLLIDIVKNEGITGLFGGYIFVAMEMVVKLLFLTLSLFTRENYK